MKQHTSSLHPSRIMQTAHDVIFEQKSLLVSIRRSAWFLFRHELTRTDPATGVPYTPYKALDNVLKWMAEQSEMLERVKREPTQMQRRILQMLADGKSQKQIALELGKNVQTVRVHFFKIRQRMGAESMYKVLAVSVKRGWVKVNRTGYTGRWRSMRPK